MNFFSQKSQSWRQVLKNHFTFLSSDSDKGRFVSVSQIWTLFFSEEGAGKCCVNHMFQFSQTTFLFWCHHTESGNKSRRDSKGLIHSHRAFQSIPEPPLFPGSIFTTLRITRHREPWWTATLSYAVLSWGLGWWVRWGEWRVGGGWWRAASLWHFCTVSRWGKRALICSMSHVPCAKGTDSLASIQRLAVSPGPLNKACVISLWAMREGYRSFCASSSSTVLCWLSLACKFLTHSSCYCEHKTVWYDSLEIDNCEGLSMVTREMPPSSFHFN